MKIGDACITYTPDQEGDDTDDRKLQRKGRILGSNPIPRSMGEYAFSIKCSTPIQDFAVGFTFSRYPEGRSVVYEGGVGIISREDFAVWDFNWERFWTNYYHKRQIASMEKTKINDTIECCLLYTTVIDRKYAIVQIMKNGQPIYSQALETEEVVWPVITISSSQTEIDTNPSSQGNGSPHTSGTLE